MRESLPGLKIGWLIKTPDCISQ